MAIHALKKFGSVSLVVLAMSAAAGSPAWAADDAEIAALKAQIAALSAKVEKMEKAAPAATATPAAAPVTGGASPGTWKLPGTDTSVKLGGYVKLDAIYDVNGANGADQENFTGIQLDGTTASDENEFRLHARESRINIQTDTPTAWGNLKTFIEGDFYGTAGTETTSNGSMLRIRHAYGEWGPWLMGQTWSNFSDIPSNIPTVDFTGVAGNVRQAQIMYTARVADKTNLSVSLENPFGDIQTNAPAVTNVEDRPDVIVKFLTDKPWGRVAVRGMVGRIDFRTAANVEKTATRSGFGASAKINVPSTKDYVVAYGAYGNGIGRYLNNASGEGAVYTLATNDLETETAWGGYAGYQHVWTPTLSSNLVYSLTRISNPNVAGVATACAIVAGSAVGAGCSVNKAVTSLQANVFWTPMPKIKLGLEYTHGYREIESGMEGSTDRIQGGAWYFF
jgi:hypothetical protein